MYELILDFMFLSWVQRGFEQQWLSLTFSKAIFLGNGLVAIVSGLFGNLLVDSFSLGPVAPFDAAACFLAIGMAIIFSSWTENYGDPSENKDLLTQFKGAAVAIASGRVPWLNTWSYLYFCLWGYFTVDLLIWFLLKLTMCFRWENCFAGCHPISLWRFDVHICVPLDPSS